MVFLCPPIMPSGTSALPALPAAGLLAYSLFFVTNWPSEL
jgi:hypothetical protein